MQGMRSAIAGGQFDAFRRETRAGWARGDIAPR
jgi:queuine tRNA-ribosyltransferase